MIQVLHVLVLLTQLVKTAIARLMLQAMIVSVLKVEVTQLIATVSVQLTVPQPLVPVL